MNVKLIIDILKIIIGSFIGLGSLITAGLQFHHKKFPMSKKVRFWRSVLVGLMIPVGIFSVLLVADVFFDENLFIPQAIGALLCPTVPTVFIVIISVYFNLGRMENRAVEYSKFIEKSSFFKNKFD